MSKNTILITITLFVGCLLGCPNIGATWEYIPSLAWSYDNLGQITEGKLVENNTGYLVYGYQGEGDKCRQWARLFNSSSGKLEWNVQLDNCNSSFIDTDLDGNGQIDLIVTEIKMEWGPTETIIYRDRGVKPAVSHNWSTFIYLNGEVDLNGDGDLDLLFTVPDGKINDGSYNTTTQAWTSNNFSFLWSFDVREYIHNQDDLKFGPDELIDVNGDGIVDPLIWGIMEHLDLVTGNVTYNTTAFLLNGSTGKVLWTISFDRYRQFGDGIAKNETGKPEFIEMFQNMSMDNGSWSIVTIDPKGMRTSEMIFPSMGCMEVDLADFSGDGYPEVWISGQNLQPDGFKFEVKKIHGGENIRSGNLTSKEMVPYIFLTKDLDGDGIPEFCIEGSSFWIYYGSNSSLYKKLDVGPEGYESIVLEPKLAAIFSQSYNTENETPGIIKLGLYDQITGQVRWKSSLNERVNDVVLEDVDRDGYLELFVTSSNMAYSTINNSWYDVGNGHILVYRLDGKDTPGGNKDKPKGKDGPEPKKYTTGLSTMFYLWVIVIIIFCIVMMTIVYNVMKNKGSQIELRKGRQR